VVKANNSTTTWMEIVKSMTEGQKTNVPTLEFGKMNGRKWDKESIKNYKNKALGRITEAYSKVSFDSQSTGKHVRSFKISKMKAREKDLFNTSYLEFGDFYDPDKDFILQKKDISVLKFDNQNSRDSYMTFNPKILAPDPNFDKVQKGYK